MQTFLPYPDFRSSAACLDRLRLGKQRVEALQILRTIVGLSEGWKNHPAVKMWRGYPCALASYGIVMCEEWRSRGYNDTCERKIRELHGIVDKHHPLEYPPWIGDTRIHSSHRAALLHKFPEHYRQFGWTEIPEVNYAWLV